MKILKKIIKRLFGKPVWGSHVAAAVSTAARVEHELARLGCILAPDNVQTVLRHSVRRAGDDLELLIRTLQAEYTYNVLGGWKPERYAWPACPFCDEEPETWAFLNECVCCGGQFKVMENPQGVKPFFRIEKVNK